MIREVALAFSHHFAEGHFTEQHLSFRIERENVFATAYENSEGRWSLGVGVVGRVPLTGRVDLFGEAALVTGYDFAPVVPMVRAGVEIDERYRLWGAPSMTTDWKPTGLVGFSIFKRF